MNAVFFQNTQVKEKEIFQPRKDLLETILETPQHSKEEQRYVLMYAFWLIERLMSDPAHLESIMDLAIIFNSFLDVAFQPYIISNTYGQEQMIENKAVQYFGQEDSLKIISITPDQLASNKLFRSAQILENNNLTPRGRKKEQNIRVVKNLIQKENLLKLNSLLNYWDVISIVFGELDTCRFTSFSYAGAKDWNEKAIGWLLLLITQTSNILSVFETLYSLDFIEETLYNSNNSYISCCKQPILEIARIVNSIDLEISIRIVKDFNKYKIDSASQKESFNQNILQQEAILSSLGRDQESPDSPESCSTQEHHDSHSAGSNSNNIEEEKNGSNEHESKEVTSEQENHFKQNESSPEINLRKSHYQSESPLEENKQDDNCSLNSINRTRITIELSSEDEVNIQSLDQSSQINHEESPSQSFNFMPQCHADDDEIDRLKLKNYDSTQENSLVKHLKQRQRRHKNGNPKGSPTQYPTRVAAQEDFKLLTHTLSPMKKTRILKSQSKSRRSSRQNSRSNSRIATPIASKRPRRLTKTEKFYKNAMLDEIRTYIFSLYRYKSFQKSHQKRIKEKAGVKSFKKILKNDQCAECLKKLEVKKDFLANVNPYTWFTKKDHSTCHLCHNLICKDCLSERRAVVPVYLYLQGDIKPKEVCKRGYKFLEQFKYIKITSKDAKFMKNRQLKNFMAARDQLNRLFDLLSEYCFEEFLSEVDEYKNLILKNCYLTNYQVRLLSSGKLTPVIKSTILKIQSHIPECKNCFQRPKKCPFCEDETKLIKTYDLKNSKLCFSCQNVFHPDCIKQHEAMCNINISQY
ncbi:unnamed protein product [Moneuplotes crassus]|uniref:Phorbol-ester/DAG-type domain-containing protein n=1 Tax=Euplotes crassus TaxID=5936 RepID=A0AAD1Y971_EUPCR|nr:unnamed protein product [Moneuplotes crassus]